MNIEKLGGGIFMVTIFGPTKIELFNTIIF